jgi:H+/Cl- antiporter ClcA
VWLSRPQWSRRVVFLGGSIAVGVVAVGFAIAANLANDVLHRMLARWSWLPFVLAPAGFAAISYASQRWFAGAQGSGIPQAIAVLRHPDADFRRRLLSLRVAAAKIAMTLVGLLCGGSIGREGPTVQIGAAMMYALERVSAFPHESMRRGLILAGGAAGVAAAFNAPLAGVVFAIEEMSRSFSQRTSGIVVAAVVFAGLVSLVILGNYAYFGHTSATVDFASGSVAVVLCGVAGGLLGGAFSRIVVAASGGFGGRIGAFRSVYPQRYAACCGLLLALIGLASQGTIYGTGYVETRSIVAGADVIPASFGVLKLLATIVSYASGIPGGIFSPSLAVGAGIGQNVALLVPHAPQAAVVILGMVAYFSGVVQAPITAFVIVIEMTRDPDMALPLMASSLLGYGLSRLICPHPVYKALSKSFTPAR